MTSLLFVLLSLSELIVERYFLDGAICFNFKFGWDANCPFWVHKHYKVSDRNWVTSNNFKSESTKWFKQKIVYVDREFGGDVAHKDWRFFRLARALGMEPERLLWDKSKKTSSDRLPSSTGIFPDMLLLVIILSSHIKEFMSVTIRKD